MRKLLTAVLALGMMMSSFMAVSAQDAASSSVVGLDTPATWTDERGNPVATISVSSVDPEFSDYSEYSEPERGYTYVAVNFTVTNISGSSLIVEPYAFSLLDVQGRNNSSAYVSQDENPETPIFSEDAALAADESVDLTMAFQVPADVAPAAFIWQPDSGILVTIDISEGAAEGSAVATGLNAPVTWTDDRGNPVATLEITGIEDDWADYDEYSEPERGTRFVAVNFTLNNVSDSNMILEPYDFTLLDNVGLNNGRSWATAAEGADPVLTEDTPIAAGETFEGTVVFALLNEVTPSAFVWQPDSGLIHMINLNEAAGEATPAEGSPEVEASPAAEDDDSGAAAELTDAAADEEGEGEASEAGAAPAESTPAAEGEGQPAASAAESTVTEVNGEPVVFNDAAGVETGSITPVSVLDGWDGYDESSAPAEGTRFVVVTVDLNITAEGEFPYSPLDFTLNTESGGTYASDLYLNSADAEVQVAESGGMAPSGETTQVAIPFEVPEGEVPTSITWNTGVETVEIPLVP